MCRWTYTYLYYHLIPHNTSYIYLTIEIWKCDRNIQLKLLGEFIILSILFINLPYHSDKFKFIFRSLIAKCLKYINQYVKHEFLCHVRNVWGRLPRYVVGSERINTHLWYYTSKRHVKLEHCVRQNIKGPIHDHNESPLWILTNDIDLKKK